MSNIEVEVTVGDSDYQVISVLPTGPRGPAGGAGEQGEQGEQGDPGEGVPAGGTTGQVLTKASDDDFDTAWDDPSGGGGGGDGTVTSVNDVDPDITGNVELTPSDIGAASSADLTSEASTRAAADSALTSSIATKQPLDADLTALAAAGNSVVLAAITAAFTTADETKLDNISVTQPVNLDTLESKLDNITVTQAVDLDAIESRVNALDAAVVLKGGWDASAGTFPGSGAAQAGDSYIVTVAGTVNGIAFSINDRLLAIADNASTTVYASNWLKLDYSDLVTSVDGLTGAVDLSVIYETIVAADAAHQELSDRLDQTDAGIINVANFDSIEDAHTELLLNPGYLFYIPAGTYPLTDRIDIPNNSDVLSYGRIVCQAANSGITFNDTSEQNYYGLDIDGNNVATSPLTFGIGQIESGGGGSKLGVYNFKVEQAAAGGTGCKILHLQNSVFYNLRVLNSDDAICGVLIDEGAKNNMIYGLFASRIDGPGLLITTTDVDQAAEPQRTSKTTVVGGLTERSTGVRLEDCEETTFMNYSLNADPTAVDSHAIHCIAGGLREGTPHGPSSVRIADCQLKDWDAAIQIEGAYTVRTSANSQQTCTVGYQLNHAGAAIIEETQMQAEAPTRFATTGAATEAQVTYSPHERIDDIETQLPELGKAVYELHPTGGSSENVLFEDGFHKYIKLMLTSADCAITFGGATADVPSLITAEIVQDATGGRTISYTGTVNFPNGVVPGLDPNPNASTVITYWTTDGGTTINAFKRGSALETDYVDHGDTGASEPITFIPATRVYHRLVLNNNNVTVAFQGATSGVPSIIHLLLVQDGTGGRGVTWPTVTWANGAAPALNTTAAGVTNVEIWTVDGGTTYYGRSLTTVDVAYNESTWNGSLEPATRNAVRDKFESLTLPASSVTVTDAAGDFTATDVEGALAELQTQHEDLRQAAASTDIIPNTDTPGFISWDLGPKPEADALTLSDHTTVISARMATIVALPACTYDNGSSGVGATLTANTQTAQAWTRSGTTVTITNTSHGMATGSTVQISASSDTAALPNGDYVVTVTGTSTFTVTGLNAGGASGTATLIWRFGGSTNAATDFREPATNDIILVKNQASGLQNGPYKFTTIGTGATPSVLTRVPGADIAAEYVDGVRVLVSDGEQYRGSTWHAAGTITMGTTSILWRSFSLNAYAGPAPMKSGMSRDRRYFDEDFGEFTTTITVNDTNIPGTGGGVFYTVNGGQATQQHGDSGSSIGVLSLETGTTSASAATAYTMTRTSFTLASTTYARMSGRYRVPTLATSSEDFNCWIGLLAFIIGSNPTSFIGFKFPAFGAGPLGNIQAVTRNAGTETATDTGVAQGTPYRTFTFIYDPVTSEVRFYTTVSGVMMLVASNTTNIPTGVVLVPGVLIDKTVGTGSTSIRVDRLTADTPEERTNFHMM
jgi:hypothetical protein